MASPHDVDGLVKFLLPFAGSYYPKLTPDVAKARKSLIYAISNGNSYVSMSVGANRQQINGALVGVGGENIWARKHFVSIAAWISNIPGDGATMLRMFKRWFMGRPAIRVAGFYIDTPFIDERVADFIERVGFVQHGGAFLLYK